jgi:hypothetical protein
MGPISARARLSDQLAGRGSQHLSVQRVLLLAADADGRRFLRVMDLHNVVAFPPVATRSNWTQAVESIDWNDAVDRLVYAEKEIHSHLTDCLTEAHLETDPDRIRRIAATVKVIAIEAAATLDAIVHREDQLRGRQGA